MRREVKPKCKQELIDGITMFWRTVDKVKCGKYIRHFQVKFLVKSDFTSNFTGFLIVLCSCEAIVKHVWRGRVHSHGCTLDVYIARDLSWGIALYK